MCVCVCLLVGVFACWWLVGDWSAILSLNGNKKMYIHYLLHKDANMTFFLEYNVSAKSRAGVWYYNSNHMNMYIACACE